jgi:hypothetical protein
MFFGMQRAPVRIPGNGATSTVAEAEKLTKKAALP